MPQISLNSPLQIWLAGLGGGGGVGVGIIATIYQVYNRGLKMWDKTLDVRDKALDVKKKKSDTDLHVARNKALETELLEELELGQQERSIRERVLSIRERAVDTVLRRENIDELTHKEMKEIKQTVSGAARAILSIENMELEEA